jgi:Type VI secretion system VasI, EvfG, VC_A0118
MARHMPCDLVPAAMSMSERDVKSPHQCPQCAAPIDEAASTCWTCGHEIATSAPTRSTLDADAPDQIPFVDWKESDPTPATVQPREAVPPSQKKSWSLALVGGAGVLACVTAMVVLQSLQPAASPQPVEAIRTSSPAPVAAAPVVESTPVPTWVGNRQATWANDGSKTISFELQATHDVNVWMSRVRPLLVVRCLYRTTEVFVATKSAASIEGQAGSHTVRLQVDDDEEMAQQWTDSVTGQELFAPSGVALVRRLASAQRLRFSFTPYNAKPVAAEFSVQGFDKLAGQVGKTCGWTLDESRSEQVRTARK